MRVLFLDTSETAIVDVLADIVRQHGHRAHVAYTSPDALRLAAEVRPDWAVLILNNITDASPDEVMLGILRTHPCCKFFFTAGGEMPDFEENLRRRGYEVKKIWPLPFNPADFLAALELSSMLEPVELNRASPDFSPRVS